MEGQISRDPCELHFPYSSCHSTVSAFIETEERKGKAYENSLSDQQSNVKYRIHQVCQ